MEDFQEYKRYPVSAFAHDILAMEEELWSLRAEVERLKEVEKDFWNLLKSSREHSDAMMGNLLSVILNPITGEK